MLVKVYASNWKIDTKRNHFLAMFDEWLISSSYLFWKIQVEFKLRENVLEKHDEKFTSRRCKLLYLLQQSKPHNLYLINFEVMSNKNYTNLISVVLKGYRFLYTRTVQFMLCSTVDDPHRRKFRWEFYHFFKRKGKGDTSIHNGN